MVGTQVIDEGLNFGELAIGKGVVEGVTFSIRPSILVSINTHPEILLHSLTREI